MNLRISLLSACALLPVLAFTVPTDGGDNSGALEPVAKNRYVGAEACKNCHQDPAKGDPYHKWAVRKDGHAQAYARLATAEAKEVGAKHGVEDPQKSEKCLKCHVTAFGVKKGDIKKGFEMSQGVQCESCHGPGETHAKTRFKEAASGKVNPDEYIKIPDDEIIKTVTASTCVECHNDKSPTFKPFCYKERRAEVAHLDPRKKRTPEEMKELEKKCGPELKCEKCSSEKGEGEGEKKTEEGDSPKK
ncbi:MAG: hypothetical protein H6832_04215 [Planctomycetes bacterium]|nr:hypothetical protein [Planctomycetota bacterium]MCB9917587.1 hypothetical protein [Planctomycetota bacterium]